MATKKAPPVAEPEKSNVTSVEDIGEAPVPSSDPSEAAPDPPESPSQANPPPIAEPEAVAAPQMTPEQEHEFNVRAAEAELESFRELRDNEKAQARVLEEGDRHLGDEALHPCGIPMMFVRKKREMMRYLMDNGIDAKVRQRLVGMVDKPHKGWAKDKPWPTEERDAYKLYCSRVRGAQRATLFPFVAARRLIKQGVPLRPAATPDIFGE